MAVWARPVRERVNYPIVPSPNRASIHEGSRDGKWTGLAPDKTGATTVKATGASAAIIKLSLEMSKP
jgi:hypothetical protein